MPCICPSRDDKIDFRIDGVNVLHIDDFRTDVGVVGGRQRHSEFTRRDSSRKTSSSTNAYWAWVVVIGCFFVQALTIGSTYTFGIVFVELLDEFGQSSAVTSWIGSIQTALLYMTGIFVGPLLKKYGSRSVAIFGTMMSVVGFISSAWVTNIYQLYFTYGVVTGIGNGLMYVSSCVVFHYHFDKWRTLANGVVVTGSGVGTLVFAFAMPALLEHLKWRLCLVVEGAVMLTGIACAALYLSPPTTDGDDRQIGERQPLMEKATRHNQSASLPAAISSPSSVPTTFQSNERLPTHDDDRLNEMPIPSRVPHIRECLPAVLGHLSLLRYRPFALLVLSNFLFGFGYHVPYAYTPNRAQRVAGVDADQAALLVSIMGGASILGRLLGGLAFISCSPGWLRRGGHIGRWNGGCSSSSVRLVVMVVVMIGSGLTSIMSFQMTNFSSMIVYATLIGVSGGVWASVFGVVVVDVVGVANVANALGVTMAFSSISVLVASPITGWIINKLNGDFNVAFALLGSLQVIGGVVAAISRFFSTPMETPEETLVDRSADTVSNADVVGPSRSTLTLD